MVISDTTTALHSPRMTISLNVFMKLLMHDILPSPLQESNLGGIDYSAK